MNTSSKYHNRKNGTILVIGSSNYDIVQKTKKIPEAEGILRKLPDDISFEVVYLIPDAIGKLYHKIKIA